MNTELITIPKETALEVFTTAKGLDPIIEKIKAEEKRQADLKHRSNVINQAAKSLAELGYDYDLCEEIISAIAENKVSNVSIRF